jgi:hypothetical protein
MTALGRTNHAGRAALLAAIGFVGIVLFQVALVVGVPCGHAAWGVRTLICRRLSESAALLAILCTVVARSSERGVDRERGQAVLTR